MKAAITRARRRDLEVLARLQDQEREADNLLLIRGAIPGSPGDYVVIREAKKQHKGWKPHAERPENIKKAAANLLRDEVSLTK